MSTEMYIYLGIDGFLSEPEEITQLSGVKPTRIQRKGDHIGQSKLRCKTNSWEYRITATNDFDLEKLVNKLFSKFKNKSGLKKAVAKGKGQIVCVLYASDTSPSIELSPKTLKRIAELNCGFWLDFYPVAPAEVRNSIKEI